MANILTLLFDGKEYPIPAIEGKTPIKGEDYFTQEDIQEIIAAVIRELPKYNGEASENYTSLTIGSGSLLSEDKVVYYEIGMTWGDFIDSKYNTGNSFVIESGYVLVDGYAIWEEGVGNVTSSAPLDSTHKYTAMY